MNPGEQATAADFVTAGMQRTFVMPDSFDSAEQERAYRQETIDVYRRALDASPESRDEVIARLAAAIQIVELEPVDDIVDRIRALGSEGAPDAYAGVSWFREAAIADRKHGVGLWDEETPRWATLCTRIDICIKLFGDHMLENNGAARLWWESFTKPLEHIRTTVLPATYLSLGNLLAQEGDGAGARVCYERCLHPSSTDAISRRLAENNMALVLSIDSVMDTSAGGSGRTEASPAGFRGSWKVLLVLAAFSLLGVFSRQVLMGSLFAAIAGAYWWFKSRRS